ncbi:OLC1v1015518C1 [Oldenlandia corymbosa var. corymbosa]|uniref:OLC1v1015518C1 n=1 Tax=Oldenlandia corymbosa var. corymbosa TaxID=529605 RepID=A0AAV1E6K1_OLDCO|nr:OLC1v1015518C1 [Oldenlandia corymbosa var. corymbosa]
MWEKKEELGAGEFCTVYLASYKSSSGNSIAAVKTARLDESTGLEKEARLLKELNGNPYVLQCYGEAISFEEDCGHVYSLFLEYANGGSLSDLIARYDYKMSESDVAKYTFMLLKGLSYIHEKGLIHCDIKPENILVFVDEEGYSYLKLADFGESMKVGEKKTRFRGDPSYRPPESIKEGIEGPSADIWSLGYTVLKMMMGRKQIWKDYNHSEPAEIPNHVSETGKDFLMRCCFQVLPSSRWTADQLINHPFIQENIKEVIPILELKQRNFFKKNNHNPLGSWSATKGHLSPNLEPANLPVLCC